MSKMPSLNYGVVIKALKRDGWVVVRQRGSHIRLQKHTSDEVLKLIVPAHKPIKRSTLSGVVVQWQHGTSQRGRLVSREIPFPTVKDTPC